MKFRRVLLTVFVLSLTLCALFINASAVNIVDSGKCGDNLTWTIDSEKTLTISGTGEMYDYTNEHRYDIFYGTDTPWHDKTVLNVVGLCIGMVHGNVLIVFAKLIVTKMIATV